MKFARRVVAESGRETELSSISRTRRRRRELSKFYGQATKGAWWMPWQKQAMKDVASCDKPRGAASRL